MKSTRDRIEVKHPSESYSSPGEDSFSLPTVLPTKLTTGEVELSDEEYSLTNKRQLAKERKLDAAGASRSKVYEKLAAGLEATKWEDNGDGTMSKVADHSTRHRFVETALKVWGDLKPEGSVAVGVGVSVGNMSKEERELIDAYKNKTSTRITT